MCCYVFCFAFLLDCLEPLGMMTVNHTETLTLVCVLVACYLFARIKIKSTEGYDEGKEPANALFKTVGLLSTPRQAIQKAGKTEQNFFSRLFLFFRPLVGDGFFT